MPFINIQIEHLMIKLVKEEIKSVDLQKNNYGQFWHHVF
jgi:hypothetical protein